MDRGKPRARRRQARTGRHGAARWRAGRPRPGRRGSGRCRSGRCRSGRRRPGRRGAGRQDAGGRGRARRARAAPRRGPRAARARRGRSRPEPGPRGGRWRAPVAAVCIVLACVLAPVSVLGVWAANQVSNTDRFVANMEPLIHEPAVQNALSARITAEIDSRIDVRALITSHVVAARQRAPAAPFAADQQLLRPDRKRHRQRHRHGRVPGGRQPGDGHDLGHRPADLHAGVVKVLSGQGNGSLSVVNDQVVLNLGPLITQVKQHPGRPRGSPRRQHPDRQRHVPAVRGAEPGQGAAGLPAAHHAEMGAPAADDRAARGGRLGRPQHRHALYSARPSAWRRPCWCSASP